MARSTRLGDWPANPGRDPRRSRHTLPYRVLRQTTFAGVGSPGRLRLISSPATALPLLPPLGEHGIGGPERALTEALDGLGAREKQAGELQQGRVGRVLPVVATPWDRTRVENESTKNSNPAPHSKNAKRTGS